MAGPTTGIDEIVRYEANEEPVSNDEVSLGITLAELAGEEASARVYADVNGGSESIRHKKDYNLEIEIDGETFRGEVGMNTGLSVASAIPGSTVVYPDDTPDDLRVSLPPSFKHRDLRSISLEERNSYETEEVDPEAFTQVEIEGLEDEFREKISEAPDRLFSNPVRAKLDITDGDELLAPTSTRRSTRWLLDSLDREPFFLDDYQNGGEVKGPTYLVEGLEDWNGTELSPAVRTRKDISAGNGGLTHNSPAGPDVAAEFYLVDSEGEFFPAPNYVVVDKMLGEGEFMIDRTDEILEQQDGNGRPDPSPTFQ